MKEIMKYVNLGLDIGSTTVKAVLTDRQTGRILFRRYQRHHAEHGYARIPTPRPS